MKFITEYAEAYDRDENNNFAVACYNDLPIEELGALVIALKTGDITRIADDTDMRNWNISAGEWSAAIIAAEAEKREELLNQ